MLCVRSSNPLTGYLHFYTHRFTEICFSSEYKFDIFLSLIDYLSRPFPLKQKRMPTNNRPIDAAFCRMFATFFIYHKKHIGMMEDYPEGV